MIFPVNPMPKPEISRVSVDGRSKFVEHLNGLTTDKNDAIYLIRHIRDRLTGEPVKSCDCTGDPVFLEMKHQSRTFCVAFKLVMQNGE